MLPQSLYLPCVTVVRKTRDKTINIASALTHTIIIDSFICLLLFLRRVLPSFVCCALRTVFDGDLFRAHLAKRAIVVIRFFGRRLYGGKYFSSSSQV